MGLPSDILATASVNGQPAASAEQVRVVALDLDGTILEPGMHLAAPLVSTLQALAGSGVCCVTATGRPLDYQLELFARHGLGSAVGVPAALMADERELFLAGDCTTFGMPSRPLRSAEYRPFDEWNDAVRARWRHLHTSAMDWLERLQQEAAGRGWSAAPLLTDEVAFARGLPTLLCARAEEATALHDWLTAALAAEAGGLLTCSRNVRLVQLQDIRVGKGPVLAALARQWAVPPRQVLAIGDSLNDLSMLDGRFGFQVATVGNADQRIAAAVRSNGGYVAEGRLGAGVLEILHANGVGGLAPTRDEGVDQVVVV